MATKVKKTVFEKAIEELEKQIKELEEEKQKVLKQQALEADFEGQGADLLTGWKKVSEPVDSGYGAQHSYVLTSSKGVVDGQKHLELQKFIASMSVDQKKIQTPNTEGIAYLTQRWGVVQILHSGTWRAGWKNSVFVELSAQNERWDLLKKGSKWQKITAMWEEQKRLEEQVPQVQEQKGRRIKVRL